MSSIPRLISDPTVVIGFCSTCAAALTVLIVGLTNLRTKMREFKKAGNVPRHVIVGVFKGLRYVTPDTVTDLPNFRKALVAAEKGPVCVHNISIRDAKKCDWILVDRGVPFDNSIWVNDSEKLASIWNDII